MSTVDRMPLHIVNWNACFLRNKHIELLDFLSEKEADIVIITETRLKPEVNVFLPDFRFIRLNRTSGRVGGVAVAVRRNINSRLLPTFRLKFV